jgi:hypothetical protein
MGLMSVQPVSILSVLVRLRQRSGESDESRTPLQSLLDSFAERDANCAAVIRSLTGETGAPTPGRISDAERKRIAKQRQVRSRCSSSNHVDISFLIVWSAGGDSGQVRKAARGVPVDDGS